MMSREGYKAVMKFNLIQIFHILVQTKWGNLSERSLELVSFMLQELYVRVEAPKGELQVYMIGCKLYF